MESGFTRTSIPIAYGSGVNTRQKRDDVSASFESGGGEGACSLCDSIREAVSFPLQSRSLKN